MSNSPVSPYVTDLLIRRLTPADAAAISDCFKRVYGQTYANELFYDLGALRHSLAQGTLCSVGAADPAGRLVGHMAMVCHPRAAFAELGNTIVDPVARGSGLAWKIGSELAAWCVERGYPAYLHYPTADHHIMQRQSVKSGAETGLMLGYIPAEVDGQVNPDKPRLRGAATVVVNPLAPCPATEIFVPSRYQQILQRLIDAAGVSRRMVEANDGVQDSSSRISEVILGKRNLRRFEVEAVGADLEAQLGARGRLTEHLDLRMNDPGIEAGVEQAVAAGFVFCGWLPGYRDADVLRMQRFDRQVTDVRPGVVNDTARDLLAFIRAEED